MLIHCVCACHCLYVSIFSPFYLVPQKWRVMYYRHNMVSQGRFPANTVKTFPIMTHIQTTDAVTGQKGKAWVLFPKYKMAK